MNTEIKKLNEVLTFIKDKFIGKDEIIDLLGISLIARENAFLLGPPGTAKSAIVRELSSCIDGGKNFEYLLTRFTEPNEIFGPFDIRKLKEGELITNISGMMPEASLVFLDEIFNANSAILNSLLMALNEKIFRRGKEIIKLPALMFVGASNLLPEDESLNALLDRFLIRIKCDYVDTDLLESVLIAGRKLENTEGEAKPLVQPEDIRQLQNSCKQVDLSHIRKEYVDLIHNFRNTGVAVSDRRAVKFQNLIAASALICGREQAILSDLWVLKHVWDTEDQIEILAGIIDNVIKNQDEGKAHPQAVANKVPNAELLNEELEHIKKILQAPVSYEEQNKIKDKLRFLQTRCNWITHAEHKQHIQSEIELLWQKMLQEV